jgi:type II secretion system protein D
MNSSPYGTAKSTAQDASGAPAPVSNQGRSSAVSNRTLAARSSRPTQSQPLQKGKRPLGLTGFAVLTVFTVAALLMSAALAQDPPAGPEKKAAPDATSTNTPAADNKTAASGTNAVGGAASTNQDIQVSFQGANIDMIVQWLAQTTGKSVVKHPQANCQLTIMSSKKLPPRDAMNLVYRAMALEGVNVVESSSSILLVPEGKEPKMNPEILDASRKDIPEGRQRLVKMFPLVNVQAADLREKLKALLSDKGTIEIDDRVNQLIVTDYNDNLRLLSQLITEFDVPDSGLTLQIYQVKNGDAEELGNLIGLIMNAPAASAGSSSRPSSGPSGRNMPGPMGGPVSFGGPPSGDSGGGGPSPASSPGATVPGMRIWPDKTSNRLVVSAPKARLVEFERLLLVLDTEKSADVTVRVLPLKNIQAMDLVKDIGPLYQKAGGGKSGKEMIEVAASDRSNALIIMSSEANFRTIEKLVASLDTEGAQDKVVRTFPLKNADAQDVAKQLQDLNRDQDNNSRYPYYFFFSGSGGDKNTRKLSVVADRRRNSLIIQAPPTQMDGIANMIAELDAPVGDDSLAPRIFHLKYASAVDIEDVLNELFLKKTQQRPYYYFFDESPEQQADRDVGRLYGKVRITSEPYSNTLIVSSNSKESLAVLENILQELDVPSEAGESTLRVQLKFAKAPVVANSINILFAKNGSPPLRQTNPQQGQPQQNTQFQQQQQNPSTQPSFALEQEAKEEGYFPWLGGQPDNPRSSDGRNTVRPVSDLVGRVRVVADQRSNSLMISANVHFFPQIMKLIEELDAPTAQVLIEARIVEVSSDYLDKLGVRWAPSGSQVFTADDYDNSILASSSMNYRQGFGGNTTVNSPAASLPNVLTEVRSGVLSATINMDFLIQFLRKTTSAKVLAEPQINIADNERGQLFVGQQVPFISNSQTTDVGGLTQGFQYKNVGIILEVTPHINRNGDVALKVRAESSAVVPGVTLLGGAIIDTREFRTDLKAKTGETLVLGGIIQRQFVDTLRKTPILGDIPGLGWLFKKKDKTTHDVELMVFLRPKITRTPEEARRLLEDIYQKAPHVKEYDQENTIPNNQPEPQPQTDESQSG